MKRLSEIINKVHLADCLDFMPEIPDNCIDLILTDPPYGTTVCKWDSVIPLKPMWEQLIRIIKPNGAIIMTASQPFTSILISSKIQIFKYCWVWEKSKASNFLLSGFMPLKAHEDIVVFCGHGKPTYNPQMVQGKPYSGEKRAGKKGSISDIVPCVPNPQFRRGSKDGLRKPRTVIYFKTAESEGKTIHPTQKPVALMEYLIKTYSNENEIILDFAIGSGTTAIACIRTNRNYIGIESDILYHYAANKRIKGLL